MATLTQVANLVLKENRRCLRELLLASDDCKSFVISGTNREIARICFDAGIWPDEYNDTLKARTTAKWACNHLCGIFNVDLVYLAMISLANDQLFKRIIKERAKEKLA